MSDETTQKIEEWAHSLGAEVPDRDNGVGVAQSWTLKKDGKRVGVVEFVACNDIGDKVEVNIYAVGRLYKWHQKGLPAFILVEISDGRYWIRVNDRIQTDPVNWMGKRPCVQFPRERFNKIEPATETV